MKRKNEFLNFCKDFWWLIVLTICSFALAIVGLCYIDTVWYARVCMFIGAMFFGALSVGTSLLYVIYASDDFDD